jgi:iron complex transport system substrate-binding protein
MRAFSRGLPAAAAAVVLAATMAACGSTGSSTQASAAAAHAGSGFPATIRTAAGTVHVARRPHAIVSLSPVGTEMLYAIGAGSQVKAVSSDSDYPPQAPRTKLNAYQPNIEAIVAEKPDLVVISPGTIPAARQLAAKLAAFSIPVLDLVTPSTVSGTYAEFDQLGQATGHLAQARQEDARIRTRLAAIVASVPKPARPITYYYELDQTYYSITSDTFVGRLLGMLGMKSIADSASGAASSGGYPQLSPEFILKANPDYIILADTICCQQSAATVAKRPGWSSLRAVRDGHIIPLNDDIASRWGPRITDLLAAVAAAIRRGGG